ncbi:hypothetical protein MAR_011687 [Mya arenaria]|uniref:Uncharacterized protein n=1 Tax=Mya arenaria TaxID=6604 RepID=A0ABY7FUR9_MYAAR|nr:hypothetical protein MAR_011687 [Mya arenaria]
MGEPRSNALLQPAPVFTSPATPLSSMDTIEESDPIGTNVMTLAATDSGSFTIGSQSPSTPTKFGISGGVTLVTSDTFDYEAGETSYTLEIV